jgi:hypothetical protein
LTVRALEVSRPLQEFEVLEIVVAARPLVTLETFDRVVLHPEAIKVIAMDSGLFPFVESGGENARAPEISVHVTLPVALVLFAGREPELQAAVDMVTTPSEMRNAHPHLCFIDMGRSPSSRFTRRFARAATVVAPVPSHVRSRCEMGGSVPPGEKSTRSRKPVASGLREVRESRTFANTRSRQ